MTREKRGILRKRFFYSLYWCSVACLISCARTYVQPLLEYEGTQQLQPPDLVLIHNFLAPPPDDAPDQDSQAEIEDRGHLTEEANHELCTTLIEEMNKLGVTAQKASDTISPVENTLSIEGEFLCLEEGSRLKRLLLGFGAGAAQINTIVRIFLHSGNHKELLQEFMVTVETPDKAGIGPAMLGFDPLAGGGIISATVSSSVTAASETWKNDIEALSDTLAKEIVKTLLEFSIRQGWTNQIIY